MAELFNTLLDGYKKSVGDNPATDITGLRDGLKQYLTSDDTIAYLSKKLKEILGPELDEVLTKDLLKDFMMRVMEDYQEFASQQGRSE